jgi:ABC-type transporter Mla maintaining outer membrane lipid asymmetry permease subunit MlaE
MFTGHLCLSALSVMVGRLKLPWKNVIRILYYSGVTLVVPVILIAGLLSTTVVLSTYHILAEFNLQHNTLSTTQDIVTGDLIPILIGLMLCVQASLNLINARIKITKQQRTPEEVLLVFVLPTVIGMDITALLLYTYTLASIYLCFVLIFFDLFQLSTHELIDQLRHATPLAALGYSFVKTLLYGNLVSLTAGYYYYQVAVSHISLRIGVSRILTRGAFWLIISSVSLKFLTFR